MSGFDPGAGLDPYSFVQGMVANWVSAWVWRAGKRASEFGKKHYPKARSIVLARWSKASQWNSIGLPFRIGRWAFRTAKNEVRAFMGIREPVRSIVAGFIAFYGAVIVWDHFAYPAEIPVAAMMAFGAYFMMVLGIIGYGMARAVVRRLRTPRGPATA